MKLPTAAPLARLRLAVRLRVVPAAGRVGVGELEHDEPVRVAVALEHLGRAAAHEVAAAVLLDAGGGERAVPVVAVGVGHVDVDEHVAGIGVPLRRESSRPKRSR